MDGGPVKKVPVRSKRDLQRSLARYREAGRMVFVSVRMNLKLFEVAKELGIVVVRSHVRDADITKSQLLLPAASVANYVFLDDLCDALEERGVRAHYLAEVHGDRRRDHFFVVDDAAALRELASRVAADRPFRVEVEARPFADEAPLLLPLEAQHRLGMTGPPRKVQFRFNGLRPSLEVLRGALEPLGFVFERLDLVLTMTRDMPTDEATFVSVLRQCVPMSRKLGCSYDGAETVDGEAQFQLTSPLPPLYGDPS